MNKGFSKTNWRMFFFRIILPAIIAISLFVTSIFALIIPSLEKNIMERKREMIRELTNSAWSILKEYHQMEMDSLITHQEAIEKAKTVIQYLQYGEEMKDYFWITDMQPVMIMHPYRKDLDGKSLKNFTDATGNKLFVEFVNLAKKNKEGYHSYMWQWKDDSTRIVPKLSFVKLFEPWGWIVGTGIYIEDVKAQIKSIEKRLIRTSVIIILIIALLLFLITRQSLRIENKRQLAENELRLSKERYRALTEASTEGSLLLINNELYANKYTIQLLGYSENELNKYGLSDLIEDKELSLQFTDFQSLLQQLDSPRRLETLLKRKNQPPIRVFLTFSKIIMENKEAIVVSVKEIKSSFEEKTSENQDIPFELAESLQLGFFSCLISRSSYFITANNSTAQILGFTDKTKLYQTPIESLFADETERKSFVKDILRNKVLNRKKIRLLKPDKEVIWVKVSLRIAGQNPSGMLLCEGWMEDCTQEENQQNQVNEIMKRLQAKEMTLLAPVSELSKPVLCCPMYTPLKKVAEIMTNHQQRNIVLTTNEGDAIGMITDSDLRSRFVAEEHSFNAPALAFMSSPLPLIHESSSVAEALFYMKLKNTEYVLIQDPINKRLQQFSYSDIFLLNSIFPNLIINDIQKSNTVEQLKKCFSTAKLMATHYLETGIRPELITRYISEISESITIRLNQLAIEQIGVAPVQYAFCGMGSVGRFEQTFTTDQDNAIVFEDVENDKITETQHYFLQLGTWICDALHQIGFEYCKGNFMAKNQEFCQPISKWKDKFSAWINAKEPKSILDISIFFDFRVIYGETALIDKLRKHLGQMLFQNNMFFFHMTNGIIESKPSSVSFTGSGQIDYCDLKRMLFPISGFARIYCLKENIWEINTLDRLNALYFKGIINFDTLQTWQQNYRLLLYWRLKHQAKSVYAGTTPDNNLSIKDLTENELIILKKIYSQINFLHHKIAQDFKGGINV